MDNFLKAAAGIDPECNSRLQSRKAHAGDYLVHRASLGLTRVDRETKQITNHQRANQLLTGNEPRKGWEFYRLA